MYVGCPSWGTELLIGLSLRFLSWPVVLWQLGWSGEAGRKRKGLWEYISVAVRLQVRVKDRQF